jgi:predicted nucleotidyltransferase
MLNEKDRKKILEIAIIYNINKLYLFGSALEENIVPNDIDLGVEGIDPQKYFKFHRDLMFSLKKPIDLIDVAIENKFSNYVKKRGEVIYERS